MEIHMVETRQKGITKTYRNDKKDVDTRRAERYKFSLPPGSYVKSLA
jgi:hypothetical protein